MNTQGKTVFNRIKVLKMTKSTTLRQGTKILFANVNISQRQRYKRGFGSKHRLVQPFWKGAHNTYQVLARLKLSDPVVPLQEFILRKQ